MNSCLECKHYKRSKRIGVKCCEFGLHESYCEKDKEDFAIEELEKIKAEIENIPNDETTKPIGTYDYCLGAEKERKVVLQILNNHISELKGE